MKPLYSTFALLAVVAGVGAWIYFNERGPVASQGSTVLLRATPQSVNSIEMQRPAGKRITLTLQNELWRVQQEGLHPVGVPADPDVVKTVLDAAQLVESAAIVEEVSDEKLKGFGLAQPQSTLIVGDAKLEFGDNPSFDSNKVYARITSPQTRNQPGGSSVALVPATLAEFPAKPFDDWREKSVLRIEEVIDVSGVLLRAPKFTAKMERTEMGGENQLDIWQMKKPVATRADAGTLVSLLQEIKQSKAAQFLEDNPKNLAKWGLEKPAAELQLQTKNGARTLRIGKKLNNGFAAQNSYSNAIFVVPELLVSLMNRPLRDWRDKNILRPVNSELNTMKVLARGQSASFELERSGEARQWKRTDAGVKGRDPKTAAQPAIDILVGLDSLSAVNFIDAPQAPSTYGFDKPELALDLTSNEEWRGVKTLQIARKDGKAYARVAENGAFKSPVFVVSPSSLEPFKTALDVLFPAGQSTPRATRTP